MNSSNSQYRVLFLLGVMRSGTTYFRNVLAANSNIRSLGSELNRFWTDTANAPCGAVPQCGLMTASDANAETCADVRKFFDEEFSARNAPGHLAYRAYRKARFGNETLIKRGRPFYLLNKSTHLLNKIGFVDKVLPDARYIVIIRNIYSQVFSMYRHLRSQHMRSAYRIHYPGGGACWAFEPRRDGGESSDWQFSDLPAYWLDLNKLALEDLQKLSCRYTCVRLESVANAPKAVLERLGSWLDVSSLNTNINRRLVNNYTKSPLDSWRDGLTNDQKSIIAQVLEERKDEYEAIKLHFEER